MTDQSNARVPLRRSLSVMSAFSWLRDHLNAGVRRVPPAVIYIIGLAPIPWLFWEGLNGRLGVEPIEVLEHRYGLFGLQFLMAGLTVTPIRRFLGINLLKFRRALGLVAFAYILAHLLVWLILDVQILSLVWQDIIKRPYITVGMVAFVLMLPLAITSNTWSIRKLGRHWHRLHWLVYVIAVLGAVHYVMLVKGWQVQPLLYLAGVVALIALRIRVTRRRQTG